MTTTNHYDTSIAVAEDTSATNSEGRIAIYAMESDEYKQYTKSSSLKQLRAMRSKRA